MNRSPQPGTLRAPQSTQAAKHPTLETAVNLWGGLSRKAQALIVAGGIGAVLVCGYLGIGALSKSSSSAAPMVGTVTPAYEPTDTLIPPSPTSGPVLEQRCITLDPPDKFGNTDNIWKHKEEIWQDYDFLKDYPKLMKLAKDAGYKNVYSVQPGEPLCAWVVVGQ